MRTLPLLLLAALGAAPLDHCAGHHGGDAGTGGATSTTSTTSSASSTTTSSSSTWSPADGAPSCSGLPACVGAVYPTAVYGQLCESSSGPAFEPTAWRGNPVCCTSFDGGAPVVIASCVERPIAGKPCDPFWPVASCNHTLVCGTDPSCAGPCCSSTPLDGGPWPGP